VETVFYKMHMSVDEGGIGIFTERFYSVHETNCYHYCVSETRKNRFSSVFYKGDESPVAYAKRRKIRLYKIHKRISRIAFKTEQLAYENLLFLKSRQLIHLKRDVAIVGEFLEKTTGKNLDDFKSWVDGVRMVPSTASIVNQHYRFD
jgi:hypothetical protein